MIMDDYGCLKWMIYWVMLADFQQQNCGFGVLWDDMGVSENTPKTLDGLFHGKPHLQMDNDWGYLPNFIQQPERCLDFLPHTLPEDFWGWMGFGRRWCFDGRSRETPDPWSNTECPHAPHGSRGACSLLRTCPQSDFETSCAASKLDFTAHHFKESHDKEWQQLEYKLLQPQEQDVRTC